MANAKGAYIGGVPVQFKDAAARAMISDEYNSAETYAKGNLCVYNGKIYEAVKETTGTWDATAWEETTLAKVNSKLNGDIISVNKNLPEIQFGDAAVTPNAGYVVKVKVTFEKPFSKIPVVVATPATSYPQTCDCSVAECTENDFAICFKRSDGTPTSVYWIAMAK
nr:MAG TPA_asm: H-type lectin domain [Caudoviricetes sp.]